MDVGFPHWIGLLATAMLVATLCAQTIKQWRECSVKGVSRWFFLGQVTASVGFITYSWLIGSVLFVIANTLVLASAFAGYVVLRLNRRRSRAATSPAS